MNDSADDDFAGREWRQWVARRQAMKDLVLTETTATMSRARFESLAEYSTTLPTGTFLRKIWKREIWESTEPGGCPARGFGYRFTDRWLLGEYVHSSKPDSVDIKWREIVIEYRNRWPGKSPNESA